ncbi:DUF3761 domain-containing protein [Trinickia terrae]|uniref:DUF3761 domain-containing protein n=1 Tax=Trinickia terrae TaxID=2571161 RepID=A0A4U1I5B4_9BURK|nr:DUF3761 domain-containing protein [Trinickia terrae]TKC88417.1 DUF3761 domain-containing protein [Trinickia terrae]
MKTSFVYLAAAALFATTAAFAQVPASAPSGSTALCKDGTFYAGASKQGACAGHKGIKTWYGASNAAAGASSASVTAPAAAAASASSVKQAAGGAAPGQVWVNTSTKVYHCPSDKYYGKTKNGAYMTEADAKAKGFHADHGKACQ